MLPSSQLQQRYNNETKIMEIYNTDTQETVEVTYRNSNGCDMMPDISSSDESIRYNRSEDRYEADSSAIEWWSDYVERQEQADAMLSAANAELTCEEQDELREELENVWLDYESGPQAEIDAIKAFMTERNFALIVGPYGPYFQSAPIYLPGV